MVLIGKPREPPARVAALRQALLEGRLEAALPGHSASDPSLFSGQLWPLQFSRSDRFRRHVRAPDGHRALGLLTLDHDQFDAWRRLHRWIEPVEDEHKPTAEIPVPLAVQMPFRPLKSLWIVELNISVAMLDTRLLHLIPPDSSHSQEMTREGLAAALGYIITQGRNAHPVEAIRIAEARLVEKFGRTGKQPGSNSPKWLEALLANPPHWLRRGLEIDPD